MSKKDKVEQIPVEPNFKIREPGIIWISADDAMRSAEGMRQIKALKRLDEILKKSQQKSTK